MDIETMKALCEPSRCRIVMLLSQRAYCVSALARKSQLSESAVSQHLKILREAGLVYGVKRGYYTHYCVDRDALGAVIDELSAMRDVQRKPCDGPFYGCPEAEHVRCKAYVPPEKRRKEEENQC